MPLVLLMMPGTMPIPPRPPRPYAEFTLGFVIGAALEHTGVMARLDAFERALGQLVRQWRGGARLSPARDIRVSPETLRTLMGWVEGGTPDGAAPSRLGVYHSGAVADPAVPAGWVRIYVAGGAPAPAR